MAEQARRDQAAWEGQMFRLLAENVTDYAIFVVSPDRRVLSWSPGAERLLGFTEEEIVGQPCDRFFTPEDVRDGVPQRELDQALRTGRGEDDRWHVRKDGMRFWSSGVVTPLRAPDGALRGFAKVMRDRTELHRAAEVSWDRVRQLQFITDHAPVLIAHCDADRRFKFVNKPYAERFGLHPRDVIGHSIPDVLGEEAYARIRPYVDAALGGQRVEFEVAVPYKTGGTQQMQCAYEPEFGASGEVVGYVAALVNVTERRQAEERFARFMQHLPGLAWIKDLQGRYVYANDAAMRAFRRPRADLYGKTDEQIFPPETAAQFRENDGRALGSGAGVQVIETLRHEDGVLHYSVVSKFPIPGPDGGPALVGGMAIDITEMKRMEEALREADRLKDEFLAMLAHELRNPLAPIRNALHVMKQPAADVAAVQRVRDMAERQVQHMARLLDDLLDVSRISRGKIELRKEVLDVTAVVSRAVEAVRPLLAERQHRLTVSLPPAPLRVEADPTRLEQILANLLNNAAKYTDPGGHVSLTAEQTGGEVVLRVRDTGIGIAPDMLPRIFGLFVQAERRLDRARGGVGIGLTLVKRLVEMHGGTVEADSAGPGRGSEFVVRLPLHRVDGGRWTVDSGDTSSPSTVHRPPSTLRVLVVDDNVDAADSVALLMRMDGHEVRTAYDGPTALRVAPEFRPQVVLLDIGMPGMDGYEVARRLRGEFGREVLLVAMTGFGQEEDRRRATEAGFDHHLVKPADPAALDDILRAHRVAG
jgi:PAS domain S-box-containing protein